MRQNIVLVALSALTAVASAQNQGQNFTIDVTQVDDGLKSDWCGAQYNSCNRLCFDGVTANDCDNETLDYNCLCRNGTAPGLQYYTQTIPFFVCETAYDQCVRETDSSREQDECKTNIKDNCGKIDPVDAKPNSEPAETTTSDGPAPTDTGSDSQNEANTSTSTAGAAPTNFAYLGNGAAVVAAGVFAALL